MSGFIARAALGAAVVAASFGSAAAAEFDAGHDEREDQRRDQRRAVLAVVLVMMSAQATTAFAPSASSIAPKVTNVRLSARAITPAS